MPVTRVKICCIASIEEAKMAVKELGGTGRVHNWALSRKIRESINKPLFLAGGLNPVKAVRLLGYWAVGLLGSIAGIK